MDLTEHSIVSLLANSDRAVERAIVALHHRTVSGIEDGIGFQRIDKADGRRWANWILAGNKLTGYHLMDARLTSVKYRKQLLDIARQNAAIDKRDHAEERAAIQSETM